TYRANRLCCEAADRAMQVHGGIGYSRALPFEHIYRHHRRYRITEGTEEVQIRRVAQYLFNFSCQCVTGAWGACDRGIDFEVARLDEYLKGWLGGAGPIQVERTHGGMSNPT